MSNLQGDTHQLIKGQYNMEISFIVTSYKFEKYIVQCVESILSQELDVEYEVLVRDDHSQDNTNQLLIENFGHLDNVRIIESESNLGAFGNLKLLISLARGRYIVHIDGDDFFTSTKRISEQYRFLEENPDFAMNCSGYRQMNDRGEFSVHHHPLVEEADQKDMSENNWVTFGRMWRKEATETPDWISKMPYLDWVFNYMIARNGKIKCDFEESGVYRISDDGMFSKKPRSEKRINYLSTTSALSNMYELDRKIITITDCFVRNQQIENKLSISLGKSKSLNNDVMLISNTPVSKDLMSLCDFFLYDKRNQLFEKEYENTEPVDFYVSAGDFMIHNVVSGMQRHGLSVLINLYNSVAHAKTLGYKYFQRIECDDLFGPESLKKIKELQEECVALNKRGVFYVNDNEANISFHYFFWEIDHFLENVYKISKESDYEEFVRSRKPIPKFMIAEEFIYESIVRDLDNFVIKDGGKMDIDFPDTDWNTETSDSNMGSKYNGCITGIYRSDRGDIVCSYNYSVDRRFRKIIVVKENGEEDTVYHDLAVRGSWSYHQFDLVKEIRVYEMINGEMIYSQKREETDSYITF